MTSFAIIAETAPKVNVKISTNGAFAPLVEKNTPSYISTSRGESFDSDPHATNTWSHPQLQDFDLDSSLPLNAEQVLFCTSQLGAMGCSHAELEQFFDDLLTRSPYWYPNFLIEAAKYDKSLAFLFDVCDAFVDSITPVEDYVRIAGQLFCYQRDGTGYEIISLIGTRGDKVVELAAYPHEVQQVKQELAWT